MPVIAIDAGITACKAGVFEGGRLLGYACRHYGYDCPHEGWAEQDATAVWRFVDEVVQTALAASGVRASIKAICLSVQGDAVIPIDANAEPLARAILGVDNRSLPESDELEERFGSGPLYSVTGMPPCPLNAITKVLWLERHRRDIARQVWKYVHYEEFFGMKLAGVPALDFSMASRTMAFDSVRKDWLPLMLEYAGIDPGHLGNVTPSGVPVGIVRTQMAERWRIPRNTLLVSGGHNQCMAATGAGATKPGVACYSMGAAEVISTSLNAPKMLPAMLAARLPCYCHALPDKYLTMTLNQSGGGLAVEWLSQSIFGIDASQDGDLEELFNSLEVAPAQVLFLPHLAGGGTAAGDYLSRGAFIGLSLKSGRAALLQAVMDAQAFEARMNLETLEQLDIAVNDIRAVDYGSRLWKTLEIKATVLNRPIHTLKTTDAALLGAAMLAQAAVGDFADVEAAGEECVRMGVTIEPVLRATESYLEAFERYRPLYATLRPFYHHWRVERLTAVPV